MLASLNRAGSTFRELADSGRFCVNILGADQEHEIGDVGTTTAHHLVAAVRVPPDGQIGDEAPLRVEPDAPKRRELTRDIIQLAAAELPAIPIHQPLIPWAMRKNVSARVTPVNTLYFYRTRID